MSDSNIININIYNSSVQIYNSSTNEIYNDNSEEIESNEQNNTQNTSIPEANQNRIFNLNRNFDTQNTLRQTIPLIPLISSNFSNLSNVSDPLSGIDSSGTSLDNIQQLIAGLIQGVFNIPSDNLQVELVQQNSQELIRPSVQSLHNGTHLSIIDNSLLSNENNVCSICHADFQENDIIRTINTCSHYYHANCIEQWFNLHNNCPVCRTEL